jgi:ABC-type multidrug transport system ATPase subunit
MILLDEPSMGLAPQLQEEIFEIVKKLNEKEGVSFLLAEQNTNIALRYATYGYILESGRVVMDGVAKDLRENEDVKEFYLGVGGEGRRSFRTSSTTSGASAGWPDRPATRMRMPAVAFRPLPCRTCGSMWKTIK